MMRIFWILALSLTLLAAVGGCAKKKSYTSLNEVYAKYDVNKDGKITKEEMKAHRAARKKSKAAAQ